MDSRDRRFKTKNFVQSKLAEFYRESGMDLPCLQSDRLHTACYSHWFRFFQSLQCTRIQHYQRHSNYLHPNRLQEAKLPQCDWPIDPSHIAWIMPLSAPPR